MTRYIVEEYGRNPLSHGPQKRTLVQRIKNVRISREILSKQHVSLPGKAEELLSEVIFHDRRGRDGVEWRLRKATHFTYAKTTQLQRPPDWTNWSHQPKQVTNRLCKKTSVSTIPLPCPQHQRNWFGKGHEIELFQNHLTLSPSTTP